MQDYYLFTTRKLDLTAVETRRKNPEPSRWIKYMGKACGIIHRPTMIRYEWVIELWIYPLQRDGFDSGLTDKVTLDKTFTSCGHAIKFLKEYTHQLTTVYNIRQLPTHPWRV